MQRKINRAIPIIAVLLLICFANYYTWRSFNRFSMIQDSNGLVYQLDRRSGDTWVLIGGQKALVRDVTDSSAYESRELDSLALRFVTGSASPAFSSGGVCTWNFAIHNGLDFALDELVISFSLEAPDSTVLWTKDYRVRQVIQPLTSENLRLVIPGTTLNSKFSWTIKSGATRNYSNAGPNAAKK